MAGFPHGTDITPFQLKEALITWIILAVVMSTQTILSGTAESSWNLEVQRCGLPPGGHITWTVLTAFDPSTVVWKANIMT